MATQIANLLYNSCNILAHSIEKDFNPEVTVEFAASHWIIPISFITLYMLFCYYGVKVMKDKAAFDLKFPLGNDISYSVIRSHILNIFWLLL